jgi:large subunit ribosomal protein L23
MKSAHDVILAPVVSEKSYDLIEKRNTYTFEVDPRSNKEEIRDAVESIFGVKVLNVNTMNRQGKRKRYGYKIGKRKDTKRAVVTLASGDSIDLFGV